MPMPIEDTVLAFTWTIDRRDWEAYRALCRPRSSGPVSQHPSRNHPVTGSREQVSSVVPRTLRVSRVLGIGGAAVVNGPKIETPLCTFVAEHEVHEELPPEYDLIGPAAKVRTVEMPIYMTAERGNKHASQINRCQNAARHSSYIAVPDLGHTYAESKLAVYGVEIGTRIEKCLSGRTRESSALKLVASDLDDDAGYRNVEAGSVTEQVLPSLLRLLVAGVELVFPTAHAEGETDTKSYFCMLGTKPMCFRTMGRPS